MSCGKESLLLFDFETIIRSFSFWARWAGVYRLIIPGQLQEQGFVDAQRPTGHPRVDAAKLAAAITGGQIQCKQQLQALPAQNLLQPRLVVEVLSRRRRDNPYRRGFDRGGGDE